MYLQKRAPFACVVCSIDRWTETKTQKNTNFSTFGPALASAPHPITYFKTPSRRSRCPLSNALGPSAPFAAVSAGRPAEPEPTICSDLWDLALKQQPKVFRSTTDPVREKMFVHPRENTFLQRHLPFQARKNGGTWYIHNRHNKVHRCVKQDGRQSQQRLQGDLSTDSFLENLFKRNEMCVSSQASRIMRSAMSWSSFFIHFQAGRPSM